MFRHKSQSNSQQAQPQQPPAVPDDEPSLPQSEADIARVYAQLFAGPAGQRVLNHLKQRYLYTPAEPDISEAGLRHAQGQRDCVLTMLRFIERGRGEP
jgi:hypothetical protein